MEWEDFEEMPHAKVNDTVLRIKSTYIPYSYGTHIYFSLQSFSNNKWEDLRHITSKDSNDETKNIPEKEVIERLKKYAEYLYADQKKEFKVQTFSELLTVSAKNWEKAKEIAEEDGHRVMEIHLEGRKLYPI